MFFINARTLEDLSYLLKLRNAISIFVNFQYEQLSQCIQGSVWADFPTTFSARI